MNIRMHAIHCIAETRPPEANKPQPFELDFYGEDVFNAEAIKKHLPSAVAEKLLSTMSSGATLDPAIAGEVANAMKSWALERGATHFTHWFQPMTGGTAEKHDSFLELSSSGKAIMAFSGKNLIVGEPDASSFPSGGLRSTFEARGYTAWDPTSPAFIKRHGDDATLCIPTAFCSYTGEALDKKTPLLRSIQALKKSVKRLMDRFGLPESIATVTLGIEQEYFLIDKRLYLGRPDLLQTGRTLFGAPPAKHQQLDDHYFGSIKPRILDFMTDVEDELWRLGIPARTRHNEVAPSQFEIAPIFEEVNLAVDHNMMLMEVLRQKAERHGLVCLLHEKPFAGVNGSGKHNNWSISYGKRNLLDPGDNPHQNAIFLTVLTGIIRAVDLHGDLLRAAVAGAGNDHRLGANEAPPAIMSMFLGSQLTDIIEQIERGGATSSRRTDSLRIGVDALPTLPRDTTDRNRTSPFAFTGNKFEFRAVGSSHSCAGANIVLNTIVAESLNHLAQEMEDGAGKDFNTVLQSLLQREISAHKRILFNGDNYSQAWSEEAARRGLPNARTTMESLRALREPENAQLFSRLGIFTPGEMASRYEILLEEYHRKIRIEGRVAFEVAASIILPVAQRSFEGAAKAAHSVDALPGSAALRSRAETLGQNFEALTLAIANLERALPEKHEVIIDAMAVLRKAVDAWEALADDAEWPLPKYREMLFIQ